MFDCRHLCGVPNSFARLAFSEGWQEEETCACDLLALAAMLGQQRFDSCCNDKFGGPPVAGKHAGCGCDVLWLSSILVVARVVPAFVYRATCRSCVLQPRHSTSIVRMVCFTKVLTHCVASPDTEIVSVILSSQSLRCRRAWLVAQSTMASFLSRRSATCRASTRAHHSSTTPSDWTMLSSRNDQIVEKSGQSANVDRLPKFTGATIVHTECCPPRASRTPSKPHPRPCSKFAPSGAKQGTGSPQPTEAAPPPTPLTQPPILEPSCCPCTSKRCCQAHCAWACCWCFLCASSHSSRPRS